jgi:hypothetical protein
MNKVACLLTIVAALLAGCNDGSPGPASTIDASAPGTIDAAHQPGDPDASRGDDPDAATPPLGDPTWSSEMTAADGNDFYTRKQPEGAVERNIADPEADDGLVARLRFPGLPALGNPDRVGPAFASELATNSEGFHFGTYRMRVKLAKCAPGEEVVNGLFTYFNDGADHDGDGLVDNSEIDIEVLCATPRVVFLSVWTDYSFATEQFRKITRAIDFATGDIWESPSDHEYGLDRKGNDPTLHLPDLLDPSQFVELGFEWHADRVRYFALVDGQEKTLWELSDAAHVPQLPAAIMFNVWHTGEHWFGGGAPPDYPASDAVQLVDWIKYWAE